jgi:hypothetical protein
METLLLNACLFWNLPGNGKSGFKSSGDLLCPINGPDLTASEIHQQIQHQRLSLHSISTIHWELYAR